MPRENPEAENTPKPFVWSVSQLDLFLWNPKIFQLLTGPGTQQ